METEINHSDSFMNCTDKSKTSTSKFEEFFTTRYNENLYTLLEKYSDERSLIVNYRDLEIFDCDLADLLIDRPEEVIEAAQISINNIVDFKSDINVRFENVTNQILLKDIKSRDVGRFISVEGRLKNISDPRPRIEIGVFECRGCMRLHEVEQTSIDDIIEPSLCSECGGRSFQLLQNESKYIDTQTAILTHPYDSCKTSKELIIIFEDDLTKWDGYYERQLVKLTGTLKIFREVKHGKMRDYLYVNHIEFLEDVNKEDYFEDKTDRNTPEYKMWVNKVKGRDRNICQCCGEESNLHAHHIYGYQNYPELRLDVNNGITLCKWCHNKYHSKYGLGNANLADLLKFFNRYGKTSTVIIMDSKKEDNNFNILKKERNDEKQLKLMDIKQVNADDSDSTDYKTILNVISDIIKSNKDGIDYDMLISLLLKNYDIEEQLASKLIKHLYERGIIYKVANTYYGV